MTLVDSTTSSQARVTQGSLYVQARPDPSKLYRTDSYGVSAGTQIGDWKYRYSTQGQPTAIAVTEATFANFGAGPVKVTFSFARRTSGSGTCSSNPLAGFLITSARPVVVPAGDTLELDWSSAPYVSSTPATGHFVCVGFAIYSPSVSPVDATSISFGASGYRLP